MTIVLDAAALLAEFNAEPGADMVVAAYPDVAISAVNLAEVVAKLCERGASHAETDAIVAQMHCPVHQFDTTQARLAGQLRGATRTLGLSLGDRACLALALTLGAHRVLTTDRAWRKLDLGIDVQIIR